MKLSASISSRDWSEFSEKSLPDSLGSSNGGMRLNTPLVGWSAFSATFRVMFVEEFRENLDFAKKRRILLFPLLVALVTMVATIGLQFLVGEGAAQGSDPDAVLSRSEAFLKSNDLEKCLLELTQLDGIALKVMEPWRISAENRINSLLAVEQLAQSIEK